jgi:hypothetical protein
MGKHVISAIISMFIIIGIDTMAIIYVINVILEDVGYGPLLPEWDLISQGIQSLSTYLSKLKHTYFQNLM